MLPIGTSRKAADSVCAIAHIQSLPIGTSRKAADTPQELLTLPRSLANSKRLSFRLAAFRGLSKCDIIKREYEPYTSPYATNEIDNEPDMEKRERMWGLIEKYGITLLDVTEEVERLASLYVKEGAVSPAYITDAAHLAITAVNGLDYIVSLNFTHIARPWTIERVRRVNRRENYAGIGIYKPAEVLEIYEDSSRIHE